MQTFALKADASRARELVEPLAQRFIGVPFDPDADDRPWP
jgi:hypothetical protein